jgi:hypothetical protein
MVYKGNPQGRDHTNKPRTAQIRNPTTEPAMAKHAHRNQLIAIVNFKSDRHSKGESRVPGVQ